LKKTILCATFLSSIALLGTIASTPVVAATDYIGGSVFYPGYQSVPLDDTWNCRFPQGGGDPDLFTPFPYLGSAAAQFNFSRFPNYAVNFGYDDYGLGVRAVATALSALSYNVRNQDISTYGWLGAIGDMTANEVMARVQRDSGIVITRSDPQGIGELDQMIQAMKWSGAFYLRCKARVGASYLGYDSEFYQNTSFMPDVDLWSFWNRINDGTVFILQTNTLTWVASKNAYTYGDDNLYVVKGFKAKGSTVLVLFNVATGAIRNVTLNKPSIRNIWSTGKVSSRHTVTSFDDPGDTVEVIVGYAGMDALVNHF
jgi:hypothetical protein